MGSCAAQGLPAPIAAEAGATAEGQNAADLATQVNPGNQLCRLARGMTAVPGADLPAAVLALGSPPQLSGEHPLRNMWFGFAQTYSGHDEEARDLIRLAAASAGQPFPLVGALFGAVLDQDQEGFARVLAESPLVELAQMDTAFSWWHAGPHARMGDRDEALR